MTQRFSFWMPCAAALLVACSDDPEHAPLLGNGQTSASSTTTASTVADATSQAASAAATGGAPTGVTTGTSATGGVVTGGVVTGGVVTGGSVTDGVVTGGSVTGGTLTGGTLTGGTDAGGTLTGASTGTDGTGGATTTATGTVAGDPATTNTLTGSGGGATSSSTATGGAGGIASTTGSATTGSAGTGGTPNPDANCGTHKWACWPMPNPANSGLPNPASYTNNGDGTVNDNVTGLVWQAEQPGQTFNWNAAINYCDSLTLAGQGDWRIPTRIEILSVLDYSKSGAKWAGEAFPGASGGFHHSGSDWILTINQTGAGAGNDFAWAFNMSDGILSNAYSKGNSTPVRCVRGGGAGEAPSEPAVPPPNQYTIVADGEARDNYTGLVWQQGDSDSMLSWQEAVQYCDGLTLGGQSWRLPTIRELSTLVDEAAVAPSINEEVFPDTHYGARSNNWYWASHQQGSAAWGLNFDDGFTGFNSGSAAWNTFGPSWARCVR